MVQTLQTEATTLSAKFTLMENDATRLRAENRELKLRLQAIEQHAELKEAINETLRGELQRLKMAAAEIPTVNGKPFLRWLPQFSPHQPALHSFGMNQTQQQQKQQQHIRQSN